MFDDLIGQDSVKATLSFFAESYKRKGRLPFITLVTGKGGGKTRFMREFRENLLHPDHGRPPMLEVNSQSIKNARAFFEQVFPIWKNHKAFLFLDECHALPNDLQQLFLTALNSDESPVRTVRFDDYVYEFDFREMSIGLATTDHQLLAEPLRDRLRFIHFQDYTKEELFEIFCLHFKCSFDLDVAEQIKDVLRGNPRDAVLKGEELQEFCMTKKVRQLTPDVWDIFCAIMGIHPYGLNASEMRLVKILGKHSAASLTHLAASSGFSRSVIQQDYEKMLLSKGLLVIDGKRQLTPKGHKLFQKMLKRG